LTAGTTEGDARAAVDVGRPGLFEAVFQVEEAAPGTGVYLGDSEGRPVLRIVFLRDPASGATHLAYLPPGESRLEGPAPPPAGPIPPPAAPSGSASSPAPGT